MFFMSLSGNGWISLVCVTQNAPFLNHAHWERGAGSWELGVGSGELGVGSGEQGVGSGEQGVGSGEQGVGSWELGAGRVIAYKNLIKPLAYLAYNRIKRLIVPYAQNYIQNQHPSPRGD
jgi:hypothetical protein